MYVWGRMLRMAATVRGRGPIGIGEETSMPFRCLPGDVDVNLHMNNARYMALADVGRIDIFLRMGLFRNTKLPDAKPLMGGVQCVYLKEIRLWKRFSLLSSIATWDDRQMIGQHRFVLENGEIAALILTTAGIYDGGARKFLDIGDALRSLGHLAVPRPLDEAEQRFLDTHSVLRAYGRSPEPVRA